jgi:very-short-patch-repair endonuclease
MPKSNVNKSTRHTLLLDSALKAVGVETVLEHFDGHKHVDIFVPKGNIYIEIDGAQHYTSTFQLQTDFERDHHSDDDGFHTLRIPNSVVETEAIKIARAIRKMLDF